MTPSFSVLAVISLVTYLSYAVLYGAMALSDRSRTIGLFFLSILLALISAITDAFSANGSSPVLFQIAVVTAFLSALAMLAGSYRIANRRMPRNWYTSAIVLYGLHQILFILAEDLTVSLLPSTSFIVASYLVVGCIFWNLKTNQQLYARISAVMFILNALFQVQYPFVRTNLHIWQFAAQLVLGQFTMLSFLVLYHRRKNDQLEESRSVLANYIDTSPIGIIVANSIFEIKTMNRAAQSALGFSASDLVGTELHRLIAEWNPTDAEYRTVIDSRFHFPRELVLRNKSGKHLPCRITQARQENGDMIIFCEDVSDEKLAERERADLQQLVFQSSKLASLGELAASVAHEINTPLAVIRSAADLVRSTTTGGEGRPLLLQNNLHRIDFGVKRIDAIIRSMLSIARTSHQEADLVDLRSCIEDTLTFLTVLLNKDQVQVSADLGTAPLPVLVRVDEINQILTNLITNSRDAVEKSPLKHIRISTRLHESTVDLLVSDSGCGISPERAERVFERFFTTKRERGGTGLGLAISRKMARSNNGDLSFHSAPGNGTTFVLSLPIHHEALTGRIEATPTSNPNATRVLVVDDEPNILDVMEEFLTSEGYEVSCTSTVSEALELLRTREFDVVFTDYIVQNAKGTEVVNYCRNHFSRNACRVYLITGYSEERPLNADGIINKPFGLHDIRQILNSQPKQASSGTPSSPAISL
jgi:PAS domain S-box-containing protein